VVARSGVLSPLAGSATRAQAQYDWPLWWTTTYDGLWPELRLTRTIEPGEFSAARYSALQSISLFALRS